MLSAWDKVEDEGHDPEIFLTQELPLLDQYLRQGTDGWDFRIYGLSAQGGDYEPQLAEGKEIDPDLKAKVDAIRKIHRATGQEAASAMTKKTTRVAKRPRAQPAPAKRPRGRPTIYSLKLARSICERLADGVPMIAICAGHDMPTRQTVRVWETKKPDFSAMILEARKSGADALAEQCLAIAENVHGDVGRDRVRISTRMWLASKLAPRRYGTHVNAEVAFPSLDELLAGHRPR